VRRGGPSVWTRAGRLAAAQSAPTPAPRVDLSRFTNEEIEFLADLGERRRAPGGGWDVTAMTPDERLALDAVLVRAGVP